jgi:hypothetical protein
MTLGTLRHLRRLVDAGVAVIGESLCAPPVWPMIRPCSRARPMRSGNRPLSGRPAMSKGRWRRWGWRLIGRAGASGRDAAHSSPHPARSRRLFRQQSGRSGGEGGCGAARHRRRAPDLERARWFDRPCALPRGWGTVVSLDLAPHDARFVVLAKGAAALPRPAPPKPP